MADAHICQAQHRRLGSLSLAIPAARRSVRPHKYGTLPHRASAPAGLGSRRLTSGESSYSLRPRSVFSSHLRTGLDRWRLGTRPRETWQTPTLCFTKSSNSAICFTTFHETAFHYFPLPTVGVAFQAVGQPLEGPAGFLRGVGLDDPVQPLGHGLLPDGGRPMLSAPPSRLLAFSRRKLSSRPCWVSELAIRRPRISR